MQNGSQVAEQQRRAVDTILDTLRRHECSQDATGRIEVLFSRGAKRWTIRGGVVAPQDELLTIALEALASQAKRIEELEAKLPKRGRPPKKDEK